MIQIPNNMTATQGLILASLICQNPHYSIIAVMKEMCDPWHSFVFLYAQAQQYNVAVYIVGFVIGMAPLCVTVTSPLVGYLVSTLAVVN